MLSFPTLKTVVKKAAPDRLVHSIPLRWRVILGAATCDLTSHDPILVYQMGKVGSMSIYESLRRACLPNPIFHTHFLAAENIRWYEDRLRRRGVLDAPRSSHLWVGRGLSWRTRFSRRVRWIVVTGVRDPIRRAISEIFQDADWRFPTLYQAGRIRPDRALDFLDQAIHPESELIEGAYAWLDEELKRTFGVDLYAHPFNQTAGYQIIETGAVRLLVYRLENLSRVFDEGLGCLLDLDKPVKAQSVNRASEKPYGGVYEKVLNTFTIDESLCRRIYDSKMMKHFYGAERTEQFVRQWSREGRGIQPFGAMPSGR